MSVARVPEPAVAPPASRDPLRHAPLFLLAPARSCSSVVGTMIGCHPDLYGFPELTMFEQPTVGERLDAQPLLHAAAHDDRNPTAGVQRALAELDHGGQDDAAVEAARRWLEARRSWPGEHVLDHLFALVEPRVPVEKSPGTTGGEERLRRLVAAFPRARLLHLTRHPVATARSWQRSFFLHDYPEHCLRGWTSIHARILALTETLEPGRVLRVRAEDVLAGGDGELLRIAAWLGVRTDGDAIAAMLRPERSPYAGPGPAGAVGGNDPRFLDSPAPRPVALPASLDPPPEWGVSREVAARACELAERLGYAG